MAYPNVKRVLEQQERNVSWLAQKTGVSSSYAWRMLNGQRPLTDRFRIAAADALGVPVDLLFPVEPTEAAS